MLVKFNLFIVFVVVCVAASLLTPEFLTAQNLSDLLQQSSLVGIVAIGMTVVILVAGIDLSVGSVAAFGGMLVALFIGAGISWPLALLLSVMAGAFLGGLMGGLSAMLALPSFMVTLAGLTSVRGLTYLTTDGTPTTSTIPEALNYLGAGKLFGIPMVGLIFIAVTLVVGLVLRQTTVGEYVYAVGSTSKPHGSPVFPFGRSRPQPSSSRVLWPR